MFRNRIFAGDTIMSVWVGIDNGFPSADMSPWEFTPTSQQQLQWAKWGQFVETKGEAGEKIDMPEAQKLAELLDPGARRTETDRRATKIWDEILAIWTDQVYTIGTVANVPQPVVVSRHLHNVPEKAIWSWEPGAQFGVHKPDTFWLDDRGL